MHSLRLFRTGSLERTRGLNTGECSVDGCNTPFKAKNLCEKHYRQQYRQNYHSNYYSDNRPKHRELMRNRRARLLNADYDGWIDTDVIERDKGICQICFQEVPLDLPPSELYNPLYPHIDHTVDLANGGSNLFDNVRLTHRHCNISKARKPFSQE